MKKEDYLELEKENEKLKKRVNKLESRLNSIIKINDSTFKCLFNKNEALEKDSYRFNRILKQGDKQSKTILIKKEQQEQILYAKDKMAMMGEMIDNIAHQWKQPLNNISAIILSISTKYKLNLMNDSLLDKFADDANKQITYMSETIDDFREFLKDDKSMKYFKINKILKKLKLLSVSMTSSKDIHLHMNFDKNTELFGVENELVQIFMNLISNSVDAFDKKHKDNMIFIDVEDKNKKTIITIKDTAGGIDEDILEKVFRYRFSTKTDDGGTGIGLHMSKKMLEITFNGSITVKNEKFTYGKKEYKGAVFTIKIPHPNKD